MSGFEAPGTMVLASLMAFQTAVAVLAIGLSWFTFRKTGAASIEAISTSVRSLQGAMTSGFSAIHERVSAVETGQASLRGHVDEQLERATRERQRVVQERVRIEAAANAEVVDQVEQVDPNTLDPRSRREHELKLVDARLLAKRAAGG